MGKVVSKVTDAVGLTDTGAAKGYAEQSAAAMAQVLKRLDAVGLPDTEKMKILLEMPEFAGMLEAEQLGPAAEEQIQVDPRLKEAQMQALEMLAQRGKQGLTEEDKLSFKDLQQQVGAQEQARQTGILRQMAERGTLDSGAQLAAQLSSSQAASDQAAKNANELAKTSLEAKRNAMMQQAQAASGIRSQDYQQEQNLAQARNAIQQFNTQNRQNVAASNLSTKQRLGEQQSGLRNQEQMYNKQLDQQKFENELRKAGAAGSALQNQAGMFANQAAQQSAANQQVIGGLIQGGAMMAASDKNVKKEIKPAMSSKIKQMIDEVKPYSYEYKEPKKHGEGERVGVMAQDLEKSELGKEVVKESSDGTKMIDYGKMAGTQLAATSNLMSRVEKLESMLKEYKRK